MVLLWFTAGDDEVTETTESIRHADTNPCKFRAADETIIPTCYLFGWILFAVCLLAIIGHLLTDWYRNRKCSVFGVDIGKCSLPLFPFRPP